LKEEALDRPVCRTRFGSGCGLVRQAAEWMVFQLWSAVLWDFLTLENRTNRLSRNVGKDLPLHTL